jgi:hypothetical protein
VPIPSKGSGPLPWDCDLDAIFLFAIGSEVVQPDIEELDPRRLGRRRHA